MPVSPSAVQHMWSVAKGPGTTPSPERQVAALCQGRQDDAAVQTLLHKLLVAIQHVLWRDVVPHFIAARRLLPIDCCCRRGLLLLLIIQRCFRSSVTCI